MVYLNIGGIGFLTSAAGYLAGNLFFLFAGGKGSENKRFHGAVLGFTAGLLLAFVCLSMLPGVFENFGLAGGIIGLAAGMAAAFFLEGRSAKMERWKRTSFLLAFGVSVHNIPEGMALGALLFSNRALGVSMAVIIAVHCFPEALAVLTPMRMAGFSRVKILLIALALALPMCAGAFAGGLLSRAWPAFADICMSFAAGVMLYMACGDILPESKDVWRGRLSTIGAMAGFLGGVALIRVLM